MNHNFSKLIELVENEIGSPSLVPEFIKWVSETKGDEYFEYIVDQFQAALEYGDDDEIINAKKVWSCGMIKLAREFKFDYISGKGLSEYMGLANEELSPMDDEMYRDTLKGMREVAGCGPKTNAFLDNLARITKNKKHEQAGEEEA